jgi:subfamily B ATP-binding cassette protein HlyB/CyaB
VLSNFSVSLLPGRLAFVSGPSGSGKSTLIRLLLGFQLPDEGHIYLDGTDHRHYSVSELRHYFGVVPQETVLFSGTVFENLQWADPHADLDAIVEACRLAGIHEAIDRLPLGYNTVLGERGLGLSGGQKQRLAIARALLKKPAVLLFDEATSSLDLPAAEALARTINSLKGKVTILFIAHNKPPGLLVDDYLELGNHAARVESVTRAGEAVT